MQYCKNKISTIHYLLGFEKYTLFSLLVGLLLTISIVILPSTVAYGESDPLDEIWDPIEPVNRKIFWFNDKMFVYVLRPLADGYDYVAPNPIKNGITNFFDNLRYPSRLVGDLAQLNLTQAFSHTKRFLLNTTLGIGGLIDVASKLDITNEEEDFGTALGYWGIPHGPYIVWPLLGSSTTKDTIGLIVDGIIDPINYPIYLDWMKTSDHTWYQLETVGLQTISSVNQLKKAIDGAKKASVDYYLFAQGAYYQHRHALTTDKSLYNDLMFEDEEWELEEWELEEWELEEEAENTEFEEVE